MKNITTLLFVVFGSFIFAQSTLTVFNNGGQQFYVILNGIKQNSVPQTNVSVSGINNGSYSMKLIFADGKTSDIDKNFFIEEASYITTRVIFKKGKGKLQLIGMEPADSQKPAENVVSYRPSESTVFSDAVVVTQQTTTTTTTSSTQQPTGNVITQVSGTGQNTGTEQSSVNVGTNVNGQQTGVNTSVNTTDPTQTNGNVGINVNVNVQDPTMNNGQGGVNMSINMSGTGTQQETIQQSQTTTVTTTTTSSGSTMNTSGSQQVTGTQSTSTQSQDSQSNAPKSITCKNILGDENKVIADLNDMNFDEDKMKLAKTSLNTYCLTASQAYKIIEVFKFEDDRLELSKYLYLRMIDKDNGRSLFTLFTFDSTKVEFREYMSSVK